MSEPTGHTAINQTFLPAHLMGRKDGYADNPSQGGKNGLRKQFPQQIPPQTVKQAAASSQAVQEAYDTPFVK